ncbi:MAG: hypothetical protein GXP44_03435 [bacterium]|nr:hypothetical protein [bacterium]
MPKKIIQDIIVKKKKAPLEVDRSAELKLEAAREEIKQKKRKKGKKEKTRRALSFRIALWALLAAAFVFSFSVLVSAFSSALVKITPKQEFVSLDSNFAAKRGGGDALPFETMRMDYTETLVGKSTAVEKISERASGLIVAYNAYSSRPQPLVARTRFETPDGKIYRIKRRAVIPGAEIKNGKIIPSSLELKVYADKPGEDHNIGLSDFTIPGFKGDPRYEKFYARSKTKMSGGFEGAASVIAEKDILAVENKLKETIRENLKKSLIAKKPKGYLLYDGALLITFSEIEGNPKPGDRAENFKYGLKGSAVGFLVKNGDMEKEIAARYLGKNADKAGIANIEGLKFKLTSKNDADTEITFKLSGRAHFVWKTNLESVADDLINAKRRDYDSVFGKYPSVEDAKIFFKPPWWPIMPKDKSKIHFEQILKTE